MKPQKLGFKRLYRNLDKILLLFFMVFMAMEFAWIPFTSWAAESLLKQTGYEFLSYNNAVSIFTANWLVTAQFLGLFLVNLLVAYFQTGIIFMGVRNLLDKEERSHWGFIKATLRDSWIMLLRAKMCIRDRPMAERFLKYLPVSIIFALILSSVTNAKTGQLPSFKWLDLLAIFPTTYIAFKYKNLILTVVCGVILVALIRLVVQMI